MAATLRTNIGTIVRNLPWIGNAEVNRRSSAAGAKAFSAASLPVSMKAQPVR
jgi:hypothetical protein